MIRTTAMGLGLALTATLATAQGFAPDKAHEAREHHMHLMGSHLGLLGAMAKGEAEFDAAIAGPAAATLSELAQSVQTAGPLYWVEGSSSDEVENSRALPAIWEDMAKFDGQMEDLVTAAAEMESAAASDLEALRAAMGSLGKACGTCHEDFRKPDE
ncbi:c-type cytochrome [Limimaricola pyoseonensis]|uniref:Cytochrome c556 n=1 Tax=Limimaricola pyoseonensis TaxID=521013 RepID=A0A1G7AH26_9RHOB|nr:cytochrome c [Limimaricola pyoseonensis]SDE13186.1 Cytochrome c556 [Limimaricola pyoseonensis]